MQTSHYPDTSGKAYYYYWVYYIDTSISHFQHVHFAFGGLEIFWKIPLFAFFYGHPALVI
jgi:hypothetical protein